MTGRLTLALDGGGLVLPEQGEIAVLLPGAATDLSVLPRNRVRIVQPLKPDFDRHVAAGFVCVPALDSVAAAALICVPRAKSLARALVARACDLASDLVIVDGARTDGVDGLMREIRSRLPIEGPIAKAHGKIFWFRPDPATFADWHAPERQVVEGFVTAPGVFSADGIDPASALLAAALPARPGRHVADFGAGWGYLSARILQNPTVVSLDLVEADHAALACARANVGDARARFHWADVTRWDPPEPLDAVVMNPPFHAGRAADPGLGRGFIEAAARALAPAGGLWLVANRHLPYERTLLAGFSTVEEIAGDARFKVLHAARPATRDGAGRPARNRRGPIAN